MRQRPSVRVAPPSAPPRGVVVVVVTVDDRGRLPLADIGIGWAAGTPVTMWPEQSGVVLCLGCRGRAGARAVRLDGRRRILLPPGIRHLAEIGPGARVVVVRAEPGSVLHVVGASDAAQAILTALGAPRG